ncbi:hypothetical protein K470DRAFT_258745, partial [Piedraia hortae CBS 480.64]
MKPPTRVRIIRPTIRRHAREDCERHLASAARKLALESERVDSTFVCRSSMTSAPESTRVVPLHHQSDHGEQSFLKVRVPNRWANMAITISQALSIRTLVKLSATPLYHPLTNYNSQANPRAITRYL